jgi:short-subunit dehydrogenase
MGGLADFRDRVAVVTGASSGIGAQLARDLATRGAHVALLARRVERLESLADELGRSGVTALPVPCDVADRASVDTALGVVLAKLGHVDLLVNNAGYGAHVLFKDHDVADIERMVRTNVLGTIYTIKAVLPSMRQRGGGWIVNLSSVAGKLGQPDEAVYSATKFAVTGLSEGLSYELAPLGIHVMTVYPALVRTEMFNDAVLSRMPETAKRTFMEAPAFTREVLRALGRGQFEVTVPRYVNLAYLIRSILPGVHRRMTQRLRLPVLPDLTS